MFDKKNYVLNCDICDARKMKEEDYNNYKNMIINADIVIVSTSSKSILTLSQHHLQFLLYNLNLS